MKELLPSARHCFVCGVQNPAGLHIRFYDTAPGEVNAEVIISEQHQGYPGIAHGGVIAAMLDEVAGRVFMRGEPIRLVVTGRMNVRYRKPVRVGVPLKLVGRAKEDKGRMCVGTAELFDESGTLLADAEVTLFEVSPDTMRQYADYNPQDWQVYPEN